MVNFGALFGTPGYVKAEKEASDYCQEYMETKLVHPYVREALLDHPAAQYVVPMGGSLGTVFTLWFGRRVAAFRSKQVPRPKLASSPMLVLGASTLGAIGGGLSLIAQRRAAHEYIVSHLEAEVIPHFEALHAEHKVQGLQSYSAMVKMMKDKVAEEKVWLTKNGGLGAPNPNPAPAGDHK